MTYSAIFQKHSISDLFHILLLQSVLIHSCAEASSICFNAHLSCAAPINCLPVTSSTSSAHRVSFLRLACLGHHRTTLAVHLSAFCLGMCLAFCHLKCATLFMTFLISIVRLISTLVILSQRLPPRISLSVSSQLSRTILLVPSFLDYGLSLKDRSSRKPLS